VIGTPLIAVMSPLRCSTKSNPMTLANRTALPSLFPSLDASHYKTPAVEPGIVGIIIIQSYTTRLGSDVRRTRGAQGEEMARTM
jgi:hypothetical protein